MKFIIKPDDTSLNLLLEAEQYKELWNTHARAILRAFREVSGLEFQQRVITARVYEGRLSEAGSFGKPMRLAGDCRSKEDKLATIVHELTHRLLGGNALGTSSLGLSAAYEYTDEQSEIDHRHTYLIEYDVLRYAMGEAGAEICRQHEEFWRYDPNSPHGRAWNWAMSLTFEQRQAVLQWLVARKITREHWEDIDDEHIKRIPIPEWENRMAEIATPTTKEQGSLLNSKK